LIYSGLKVVYEGTFELLYSMSLYSKIKNGGETMGFLNDLFSSIGNADDEEDYSDGISCPVCGAKAYWKDEDYKACWVCSSCGYEIDGDQIDIDDEGNGSALGIDWYCDSCNAYLNDQSGFNPYAEHWICTKCGYENSITKDDII
jgi:DNA-directed RNA polymerase subunit M/transcription elongation factor TFIIS